MSEFTTSGLLRKADSSGAFGPAKNHIDEAYEMVEFINKLMPEKRAEIVAIITERVLGNLTSQVKLSTSNLEESQDALEIYNQKLNKLQTDAQ